MDGLKSMKGCAIVRPLADSSGASGLGGRTCSRLQLTGLPLEGGPGVVGQSVRGGRGKRIGGRGQRRRVILNLDDASQKRAELRSSVALGKGARNLLKGRDVDVHDWSVCKGCAGPQRIRTGHFDRCQGAFGSGTSIAIYGRQPRSVATLAADTSPIAPHPHDGRPHVPPDTSVHSPRLDYDRPWRSCGGEHCVRCACH